ncbi:MAG: hypothetical protein HYY04_06925 [Chloroflexi bacterium]|nr:hypothetical protein [Chloroflexota bacterium]
MGLEFKEDWPEARERLEAWWSREVLDRAVIAVTARRDGYENWEPRKPDPVMLRWTDVEWVLESAQQQMRATYYGGEAFPFFFPNVGPDVFAAYLGCPLEFAETTSWSLPIVEDWNDVGRFRFDPNNRWWKLTLELIEAALEVSPGRFLVGLTDIHGGMDAISALRGPQRLCVDLLENPKPVLRAMYELIPIWHEVFDRQCDLIRRRDPENGCTTWIRTWSRGTSYPVSCDFMCMVSRELMRQFVLPDLVSEVNWLDHSVYHLDGPGAVHNLDILLEMGRLDAIQWVPGAGNTGAERWLPLLKRIQAAGRAIQYHVQPDEVELVLRELSPRGLMLVTTCATEAEARNLVACVAELTRPPRVYGAVSGAAAIDRRADLTPRARRS